MTTYYHITDPSRKAKIMREGLKKDSWVTLEEDLDDWLTRYMSDRFIRGKRVQPGLFKLEIPESWVSESLQTDEFDQYQVNKKIPPSRLEYLIVNAPDWNPEKIMVKERSEIVGQEEGRTVPLTSLRGKGYEGELGFSRDRPS